MAVSSPQSLDAVIEQLRQRLTGRVITPADREYEQMRQISIGDVDPHPPVIVRVASDEDVVATVNMAREAGLDLAVRSGGHDSAGHSTTDNGIVLDLRDMHKVTVDPESQTAWAETGASALEVTKAASEHGLVIGFGDTGSVGIGGITLGGGVGYMVRRYGLTIDNLLAADIVTADGSVLRADENTNQDLFWAIRGGGGNFGVATRFLYKLHPLPAFSGGMLILPATAENIAAFMQVAAEAPETVSTIANVMNCPPMPFLPEDVVGTLVILAMVGYSGDAAGAEQALAPFRTIATPLADFMKEMPYTEMYPPEDESYKPKAIGYTSFLHRVDLATAQAMMDFLARSDSSLRAIQLRPLGGAMARVPTDATAFAHRSAGVMSIVVNFFEGDGDFAEREKWAREFVDAIDQGLPGAYVNFVGREGDQGVRNAYPGETYGRLAAIKAKYDPTNLFHLNQNIPPNPSATPAA